MSIPECLVRIICKQAGTIPNCFRKSVGEIFVKAVAVAVLPLYRRRGRFSTLLLPLLFTLILWYFIITVVQLIFFLFED